MNETLRLLQRHCSDRSFTDEPVTEEDLAQIVEAARSAPTSINTQEVSLVVVRDAARRAKIAEYSTSNPWIAKAPVFIVIVLDLYKTSVGVKMAGKEQVIHETLEGVLAGTIDVGITLATLMAAARSLGLGVVPIGGIRSCPQEIVDLLDLPRRTFPLVGVCMGHIDKPAHQKPRLPVETFRHNEQYHPELLQAGIEAYDKTLVEYWKQIGRTDGKSWSVNTAVPYSRNYRPHMKAMMDKQGLKTDQ